ncbi:MAG: hypothetical protein KatS3mg115_1234 [Candidatus Poribacteria bacterium]|nr:MAG: hypothetical protein KatS3mg115_1234 [Candidatus Poribacteria bacterium]
MLEQMELDLVYCVMNEIYLLQPALDCLEAGVHLFIEKPPGKDPQEAARILEAAERRDRIVMVGLQRRYAAVTQEAMRRVQATGQTTLAVGEFHKWLTHPGNTSTLWNDLIHVVDLIRFMVQSEPAEVTAYGDRFGTEWKNCYTALIRFQNGAHGVLLGNRASGGRVLRAELHGVGVGCYMEIPSQIEVLEAGKERLTLTGAELVGGDPSDVPRYEGVLAMHRHLIACVQEGRYPLSDLRDVIPHRRATGPDRKRLGITRCGVSSL